MEGALATPWRNRSPRALQAHFFTAGSGMVGGGRDMRPPHAKNRGVQETLPSQQRRKAATAAAAALLATSSRPPLPTGMASAQEAQ